MANGDDDDEDDDDGAATPVSEPGARAKPISIRPNAKTLAYLQDLIDIGTYGKKPTTVVTRLLEEGIRRAITEQLIDKRRG